MKAHKYWSVGALVTMLGTFYTGYKKLNSSHKYFALSSMLCMVMAIYTGHKMITGNRKEKAKKEKPLVASMTSSPEIPDEVMFCGNSKQSEHGRTSRCQFGHEQARHPPAECTEADLRQRTSARPVDGRLGDVPD